MASFKEAREAYEASQRKIKLTHALSAKASHDGKIILFPSERDKLKQRFNATDEEVEQARRTVESQRLAKRR